MHSQIVSMPTRGADTFTDGANSESTTTGGRLGFGFRQMLDSNNLITVCSKKLEEDPNHKKALFIRATSFLKRGELDMAIVDSNKLMEVDPDDAGAYYIRGCALEKQGNIDESI